MSVRCRNQHPVGGNAGFLACHRLGTIKQFPGHHAAIDNHDRQLDRAVVQDQAPGEERIIDLRRAALEEPSIHKNRERTAEKRRSRKRRREESPGSRPLAQRLMPARNRGRADRPRSGGMERSVSRKRAGTWPRRHGVWCGFHSGSMPSSRNLAAKRSTRSCAASATLRCAACGTFLQFSIRGKSLSVGTDNPQVARAFARFKTDSQSPAHVAIHLGDFLKTSILPLPALQIAVVRVVNVVFLDPIFLVKPKLPEHLLETVSRRKHLENNLRSDPFFLPLHVRAAFPLGPADRTTFTLIPFSFVVFVLVRFRFVSSLSVFSVALSSLFELSADHLYLVLS